MSPNLEDAEGNEYTFMTPKDWGTITGVLMLGAKGGSVFAKIDPESGHLKFAMHPERPIQTRGNTMKNIFADIQARSQRMTERAKKVAEVRDEIKSSMKEINFMMDEIDLYVRQIERDNVEIKEQVAIMKNLSTRIIEVHVRSE